MGILEDKTGALDDLIRGIKPNADGSQWATGLDNVQALRMIRDTAESAIPNAVAQARDERATWEEIAKALGITRQAAWERFA